MAETATPIRTVLSGERAFHAVLWSASELSAAQYAPEAWLTPRELLEYQTLKNDKQRRERLASRIALKSLLLADGIVRDALSVSVRKDERGAPYLVVFEPDTLRYARLECSISHSGACVLVAYGRVGCRVGVDIEHRTWRLTYMKRRYLASADSMLEKDDSQGDAVVLWTFKEALSKILGTGMAAGFTSLTCRETSVGVCVLTDAQGRVYQGRYTWFGRFAVSVVFKEPETTAGVDAAPHKSRRRGLQRLSRAWRLRALRKAQARKRGAAAHTPACSGPAPKSPTQEF